MSNSATLLFCDRIDIYFDTIDIDFIFFIINEIEKVILPCITFIFNKNIKVTIIGLLATHITSNNTCTYYANIVIFILLKYAKNIILDFFLKLSHIDNIAPD